MNPTHEQWHDPGRSRRSVLLRSGAVIAIAAALLAAALSLRSNAPEAARVSVSGAPGAAVASPPAPATGSELEYSGALGRYFEQPAEQPPSF